MRRFYVSSVFMLGVVVFLYLSVEPSIAATCGGRVNMVRVGPICIDQYEASVWSQPPDSQGNPQGTRFGATTFNYPCSDNGNDCSRLRVLRVPGKAIFAASVPGVIPSRFITWFQAQQACANVGKRLPRNGEWQMAAAGTPDAGDSPGLEGCNTIASVPTPTGSRSFCVSNWGVFDMVGNAFEWVEDWVPQSTACVPPLFNDDFNCLAGASTSSGPGALTRGGSYFSSGANAGVFALFGSNPPSNSNALIGFRCAR